MLAFLDFTVSAIPTVSASASTASVLTSILVSALSTSASSASSVLSAVSSASASVSVSMTVSMVSSAVSSTVSASMSASTSASAVSVSALSTSTSTSASTSTSTSASVSSANVSFVSMFHSRCHMYHIQSQGKGEMVRGGRGERKGAGGVEKIKAPPAPFALPSFHISPCLPITLPIPYTITLRAFLLPYPTTTILGITLSVCGLCTVWFGCGSVMIWLL